MNNYFRSLLEKYHRNTASKKERWLVEQFFVRLQKDGVRPIEVDQDLELKKRLRENIFRQTQGRRTKMTWLYRGVAACLLLVLGTLALYLNPSPNHQMLVTGPGEQVEVRLPDSSVVYLNYNSRLSYPEKFAGGIRSVHIEGEAFFEIQKVKNQRFTVTSPNLKIEVLGTSFNIKDFPNSQAAVTVQTGKVRVKSNQGDHETILVKNQHAFLTVGSSDLITQQIQPGEYTTWLRKEIHFEKASLKEIVSQLNHHFDTDIILKTDAGDHCTLSGTFSGSSLEDILEGLQFIHGIQYERQSDNTIFLYAEPCSSNH